ncbi:MAG: MFS transporter [Chloroflexi bacterium]|nr:MFS transporter [Chloroflexota bacterium]
MIDEEGRPTGRVDPAAGRLGYWRAPFRQPGYPPYAIAFGLSALSWTISSVAFAWVTLIVTTEPLAVGAVFAVRFLALLVFGIPMGVLADRVDRRRMIIGAALASALVGAVLGLIAWQDGDQLPFWALIGGSFVLGIFDAARLAANAAYAFDLVGPSLATAGIAIANLAGQLANAIGGIVGGLLLDGPGVGATLMVQALASLGAAILLSLTHGHPRTGDRGPRETPAGLRVSLTLLRRDRVLALLTFMVVVVEVFGFSSLTLLPVFTREVFDAGPGAYGAFNSIRALGGVVGLLVLVRVGARANRGPALMAIDVLFGVGLITFALSPTFGVAVLPMLVIGAAAAACDSLAQSLMQRASGDRERGAAMGLWTFALGVGPIGHLVAGAAASTVGPVGTQLAFGVALAGIALVLARHPLIRALR